MKRQAVVVILLLLAFVACKRKVAPQEAAPPVAKMDTIAPAVKDTVTQDKVLLVEESDTIEGDFNGDGKKERMWLNPPKLSATDQFECDGPCTGYITFSDATIPAIPMEDCIDGSPVNEGDLNEDGADDVGMLPGWFTSCWHQYHVFSFRKGEWINVVNPFDTHCTQWEDGVDAVSVDKNKPGHVIVRYMVVGDDDFSIKEKSIKAKR